jgi:tetratricopeptide (TPR) repeat protein
MSEITSRLEEINNKEDVEALDALVQSLSADDLLQYRDQITEVYEGIYTLWYYDVICGKIKKGDEENVVAEMLEILVSVEKINPESTYQWRRAQCYELLSGLKSDPVDKFTEIQRAIDEYADVLKDKSPVGTCAQMANALLDRMLITEKFSDDEFKKILGYVQLALTEYSESVVASLLHASFRILNFPFAEKQYWHSQFINTLNTALYSFAADTPIIGLNWSNDLVNVTRYEQYEIAPAYADELNDQSIALLAPLTDYQTDNVNFLNYLGSAFEKAAKRMESGQLPYYKTALKYFTKGHTLNPATWTFPVYATNVLKAMVRLEDFSKSISLFETGRTFFGQVYEHEKDFTLNLYWGDFLIDYARFVYDFKAVDILHEATLKLEIAKVLGKNFYSQPFISLARIALKTGDRDKCLEILQECKTIFSTESYEYDFGPFLKDEDFRAIWGVI